MSNLPSAPPASPTALPALQQTWDNSQFYSSSADPQIAVTVEQLKGAIANEFACTDHPVERDYVQAH